MRTTIYTFLYTFLMLFFRLLGSQWNMVLEIGVITIAGLMLGLILCVAQDIKNLIETK